MSYYERHRTGGNGHYQSRETSDQEDASQPAGLYVGATADFAACEVCLWLVSASSAPAAQRRLKSARPRHKHYGVAELTRALTRCLHETAGSSGREGIATLCFTECPAGGYELEDDEAQIIAAPLKTASHDCEAEGPSKPDRLFARISRHPFLDQTQLTFVRAVDGRDAAREIQTVRPYDECAAVVPLDAPVLAALTRVFQLHEENQLSFLRLTRRLT